MGYAQLVLMWNAGRERSTEDRSARYASCDSPVVWPGPLLILDHLQRANVRDYDSPTTRILDLT